MNMSKVIVTAVLSLPLISGCVSSTTGSVTEHQRDDDDAAELNYQLGARYYKAGNFELARDRLLLAVEIKPKMAVAYTTLALTYEALDNERLARIAYETAIEVAPKNFDVQNDYAVFLCRHQDFDEAQVFFAKAAAHPENDYSEVTLTNAGVCMMQIPDVAAAETFFREALDRKPRFGEALLQLCLLKYQEKDYLGARAFLQRFMSVSPTTAGVLYLASMIEDMLDNDRGRTDFVDRLIREFPTSPEARKVLGAS
jgi:type IV pilus assembly protein PilF